VTRSAVVPTVLATAAGLFAGAVVAILCAPWRVGAVGFDSAASVLYFDRIVARTPLETFVGATPKPLLTVVYGVLYGLTNDWRSIGLVTVLSLAAAVGLTAWLVVRVSGPAGAGFVAIAILGSPLLLQDVALAYATPLALVLLAVAGIALLRARPAPAVAGLALLLATLTRFEVIVLSAVAVVAVAGAWLARRRGLASVPSPRVVAPLLLGWLALPIMAIHDLLLTGDPFYWLEVSARYSQENPASVRTVSELLTFIVQRYRPELPLVALAVVGIWWSARRRAVPVAIGLASLALGVLALVLILAARGTYVSTRYFLLIDLSIDAAAAIGVGAIVAVIVRRLPAATAIPRLAEAAGVVLAIALAVVLMRPWAPLAANQQRAIDGQVGASANADRVASVIDALPPGSRCLTPGGSIVIPGLMTPRLAVSMGRPLTAFRPLTVDPSGAIVPPPTPGDAVVHERFLDRSIEVPPILESAAGIDLPGARLEPLLADAEAGLWIYEVCPGTPG
jgi:hypothetical protein